MIRKRKQPTLNHIRRFVKCFKIKCFHETKVSPFRKLFQCAQRPNGLGPDGANMMVRLKRHRKQIFSKGRLYFQ